MQTATSQPHACFRIPEAPALERARAALGVGRHGAALAALRDPVPPPGSSETAELEAKALLGLLRYREAAEVAERALRGEPDGERAARLRLVRGHAVWLLGGVEEGRRELERALRDGDAPATRGRARELLGLFEWQAGRRDRALVELAAAWRLYHEAGRHDAFDGVLEKQAGLLRDEGRFEEALAIHARRLELATLSPRIDLLAHVRCDRGDLLVRLGRWDDARRELDEAGQVFRLLADPREEAVATRRRAMIDLALGDLTAVRAAARRIADSAGVASGSPRLLGEVRLLAADVALAEGADAAAEAAASEALASFRAACDAVGECRARVKRAHALVPLGRLREAERDARDALELGAPPGSSLLQLAELAFGRAQLRRGRAEAAAAAFARAEARAVAADPGLSHAARLGAALARGASCDSPEVAAALAGLEAWGERRILAICLRDASALAGPGVADPLAAAASASEAAVAPSRRSDAVVAAALALRHAGELSSGFASALGAAQAAVGWRRAVWVSGTDAGGWQLERGAAEPQPLSPDDPARLLARGARQPTRVRLRSDPRFRRDRVCALFDLAESVVVPAGRAALCLDFAAGEPGPDDETVAAAWDLARLLGSLEPGSAVEVAALRPAGLAHIVGECPALQRALAAVVRFAGSARPVHVYGETGTGKEGVAQAIHRLSGRRGRLVAVNAAALSDELFQSEMFGHARGAFSGAVADREGFAAAADRGTLFIDEVADLSPRSQARLLRFLESGEYCRLGETRPRRADLRVVSATNAELKQRVAEGRFRQDLFYRLALLRIELPPLRERGDDVLRLARHLLGGGSRLTREAAEALRRYSWPGNVRELKAELELARDAAAGEPIGLAHLSEPLRRPAGRRGLRLHAAVAAFTRQQVTSALEASGGIRVRAAQELGISRQALHGHIRRFGL